MYKMECSLGSVTYPPLESLAKDFKMYLSSGKCKFIKLIDIDDEYMRTGHFDEQMNLLELKLMGYEGYKSIHISLEDNSLANMRYFHIPGEKDSTLSFNRESHSVTIQKASINVAIAKMSESDIRLNEVLEDPSGLRGLPAYNERVNDIKESIDEVVGSVHSIENLDSSIVLN